MSSLRPITDTVVQKTIELGKLILSFGLVNRVTTHEDGNTLETDTTHTVMLGITACAFAREFVPNLDLGKVAQFALVHDLVEVYAGDTNTFGKVAYDADKEEREAKALAQIRSQFDSTYPWLGETIEEYESLKSPEARYIKVFDKILPKITHILNNGAVIGRLGQTKESASEFIHAQTKKILQSYGADQPEAVFLLREIHTVFEKEVL